MVGDLGEEIHHPLYWTDEVCRFSFLLSLSLPLSFYSHITLSLSLSLSHSCAISLSLSRSLSLIALSAAAHPSLCFNCPVTFSTGNHNLFVGLTGSHEKLCVIVWKRTGPGGGGVREGGGSVGGWVGVGWVVVLEPLLLFIGGSYLDLITTFRINALKTRNTKRTTSGFNRNVKWVVQREVCTFALWSGLCQWNDLKWWSRWLKRLKLPDSEPLSYLRCKHTLKIVQRQNRCCYSRNHCRHTMHPCASNEGAGGRRLKLEQQPAAAVKGFKDSVSTDM